MNSLHCSESEIQLKFVELFQSKKYMKYILVFRFLRPRNTFWYTKENKRHFCLFFSPIKKYKNAEISVSFITNRWRFNFLRSFRLNLVSVVFSIVENIIRKVYSQSKSLLKKYSESILNYVLSRLWVLMVFMGVILIRKCLNE